MVNFGTGVDVMVGVGVGATGGAGLLLEKISSPYLAISSAWLKTALLFGEDLLNEGISCSMDICSIGISQEFYLGHQKSGTQVARLLQTTETRRGDQSR